MSRKELQTKGDSMKTDKTNGSLGVLTIVLVVLKLIGVLKISWFWVLLPLSVGVVILVILLFSLGVAVMLKNKRGK